MYFYSIARTKRKHRLTYKDSFKGGHLDFSHLTKFENAYITEIYMKKQYKSPITKNHENEQKYFLMVFP